MSRPTPEQNPQDVEDHGDRLLARAQTLATLRSPTAPSVRLLQSGARTKYAKAAALSEQPAGIPRPDSTDRT